MQLHKAFVLCAVLASGLAAQECPDRGVQRVETKLTVGPINTCGSTTSFRYRGFEYHTKQTGCPTFVIYEPPHDKPVDRRGFFTRTAGTVDVTVFYLKCHESWLFGFIPITISSQCNVTKTETKAKITCYVEVLCPRTRSQTTTTRRSARPAR